MPQSVVVAPNIAGLRLGAHDGVITFTAPNISPSRARVVVRLELTEQAPPWGRWLGSWSTAILSIALRDSGGTVAGSGLLLASGAPFAVVGVRTGNSIALTLQPPNGAPIALNAFFFTDHVMRGSVTGPGFPGDSIILFRQ
jgi:hypothetical protein